MRKKSKKLNPKPIFYTRTKKILEFGTSKNVGTTSNTKLLKVEEVCLVMLVPKVNG